MRHQRCKTRKLVSLLCKDTQDKSLHCIRCFGNMLPVNAILKAGREPNLDLQVVCEEIDPLGDPGGQGLLDGLSINLDVANCGTGRKCLDLFLDCPVLGNLSLKAVQGWIIPSAIFQLFALSSQELLSQAYMKL